VVVLDAGFFMALAKQNAVSAGGFLARARERKSFAVSATTVAEFWRTHRGPAEARFGWLRARVIDVDEALARRAGELLAATRGSNAIDAIVVALAERIRAAEIYTSDQVDVEKLVRSSAHPRCAVVPV
jgi:predicted nucleic acid-binding protein